jgi:hypothetical protein
VANQAGLDQLDARRTRAARQVPKPHHAKAPVAPADAPAALVLDEEPTPSAGPTPDRSPTPASPAPAAEVVSRPDRDAAVAPQRKPRFRQTQVLFDARADAHLSELKKRAVMAEVNLSTSAVLRQALEEYVEAHGYDGIVTQFAEQGRQ